MTIVWSATFEKEYRRLPKEVQSRFEKSLRLFLSDPRHPSLQVKKMEGTSGIWEGRVSRSYRWTFELVAEGLRLRHIGTHDVLQRP